MQQEWLHLLNVDHVACLRQMLQRIGDVEPEIKHWASGRVSRVVFRKEDMELTLFFGLTQLEEKPKDRRHFFEAMEFRIAGKLDGNPAYRVWHDDGTKWSVATWEHGKLISLRRLTPAEVCATRDS